MKPRRVVSRRLALLMAAFAVCVAPAAGAQKLTVAAAADLRFALDELASQFRATHPAVDLAITYGSSGNFFAQIQNGAPFDVFLSADVDYPRRLVAASLASKDSLFLYGAGRIVVWVPAGSPLDPAALGIHALEAASVRHIAIANPQHAPYGRAAVAALRSLGVYDRVAPKLVLGENIAQAFEFVESGAAEVGIVALSLAPAARTHGRYWEVPQDAYPKIEQGGVILSRAPAGPAARFRAFLLSEEARRILKQYGFSVPQ
ncbi:MAG: molybdate ABC transporter substrate-binding protein [Bryobacteraceae bacterium]|jgi:molybdate transport system substrate-binding protein